VPQQSGARQAAQGIADPSDDLTTPARFARPCGRDSGQAFGKDLPAAPAISTAEAAGPEAQLYLAALPRQIAKPALILTVIGHARAGAHGAAWQRRAAHTNDDDFFQIVDAIHQQLVRHRQDALTKSTVFILHRSKPVNAAPKPREIPLLLVVLAIGLLLSSAVDVAAQEDATTPSEDDQLPGVPPELSSWSGTPRAAPLVSLYVSFGTLQVLDILSTQRAIHRGAREVDPIVRGAMGSPLALAGLKIGATALTIMLTQKMRRRNCVASIVLMATLNSAYGVVVSRNYAIRR
jgi:hypothetical protein